ncbi:MAG: SdpI family protein [Flavisolibacter sp.]|nr:SdpI family protein [Flavisolibacter sp.]
MKKLLTVLLILCIPYVYLMIIWPQLPEVVPMHFTLNGAIDRYGNKSELLILTATLSFVIILVYLFIAHIHRLAPKMASAENKERLQKIALAVVVFMTGVQAWLIYIVQKGEPDFSIKFVLVALCLLLAIMGNYMPNLKPNYVAGFRLPWTLENENNWRKTHHLAGRFWFGGGLLCAFLLLILPFKMAVIIFSVSMLALIFVPAIYSYRLFKQSK